MSKSLRCKLCHSDLPLICFKMVRRARDRYYPYCDGCMHQTPALATPTCRYCHKKRELHLFAGFDHLRPCNYCAAAYDSLVANHLDTMDLQPGGKPRTISQILAATGFPSPTKSDLNVAARYFREKGFPSRKKNGRAHFVVRSKGEATENEMFLDFEKHHPDAVKALELPDAQLRAYREGAKIPTYMRIAMAAAALGLPPYEGKA